MNELVSLKLYVAGSSARSERAIANLEQIGSAYLQGQAKIQIIDVLLEPAQAESARIMATPTLVRDQPPPERRIIGDLSDQATVLKALRLGEAKP
jgi:circadian clock protein KaiB